ncbi:3-carboxy-cis,cis-muconate cycloisomerase, partial [Phaeobacter gallaeciensis]
DATLAETAAQAIEVAKPDLTDLTKGTAQDGLPVPSLVKQLKAIAPGEAVHMGATSQDVVDTTTVLVLREASLLITNRLIELEKFLKELEERFGDEPLMGRTRMQAATLITVRDRVLPWRLPLAEHRLRLDQIRPRIERVQIGGASGDRKALRNKADEVVADVANQLDLAPTNKAWHTMRDGIVEYASLLSMISGTLGKIGQDIALMAQQGIGAIAISGGGTSSAMPHKNNPIAAELLMTLARFNSVQVSAMHHALIHEQERSGAAWALEWMVLPQMLMATARGLGTCCSLSQSITRIGEADTTI